MSHDDGGGSDRAVMHGEIKRDMNREPRRSCDPQRMIPDALASLPDQDACTHQFFNSMLVIARIVCDPLAPQASVYQIVKEAP